MQCVCQRPSVCHGLCDKPHGLCDKTSELKEHQEEVHLSGHTDEGFHRENLRKLSGHPC